MAYVVLARQLAFQPVDPANPKVPTGPEEIIQRGSFVPDYAATGLINALDAAGLIVWADVERPDLVPVGSEPVQARTLDQPAVLPSDPNGVPMFVGDITPAADPEPAPGDVPPPSEPDPAQQVPDLPRPSDNKETWENYAQLPHIGLSQAEAESMNKTDLMAQVRDRYAAATA